MAHTALAAVPLSKGTFGVDSPAPLVAQLLRRVNVTALAASAGLDRKRLYRFAAAPDNRSGEHRQLPLELAPVLEISTGRTDLVDWHAAQLGGLFVRRPLLSASVAGVLTHLAALGLEFAGVQRTSAEAIGDRCLTSGEARAIIAEVRELQRQAESFALELEGELLRKPPAPAPAR